MFLFQTDSKNMMESARVVDGPLASKEGDPEGFFVATVGQEIQIQIKTRVEKEGYYADLALVSPKNKSLPIGSPLMRQVRTWLWGNKDEVVYQVPPILEDILDVRPYDVRLFNPSNGE